MVELLARVISEPQFMRAVRRERNHELRADRTGRAAVSGGSLLDAAIVVGVACSVR